VLRGVGLVAATTAANAQPSGGCGWATIGNPGNRTVNAEETPFASGFGQVNYAYRLSQTETTNAQWAEFLTAYIPHYQGNARTDTALTGRRIYYGDDQQFHIARNAEPVAAEIGWRYIARYCNWLHNDRVNEAWAFESGAYDTSTFTQNPDGTLNDAQTRMPGARFWIPSVDEWAKAAWYDPNRYGTGQEGYWQYMNGTNNPLRPGLPGEGGETSAGVGFPDDFEVLPVGSYGPTGSWSMCDMSGSAVEWTEQSLFGNRYRAQYGSFFQDSSWTLNDLLARPFQSDEPISGLGGLRLATNVPCPCGLVILCAGCALQRNRRRVARLPSCLRGLGGVP
jgi:hypothetical protein